MIYEIFNQKHLQENAIAIIIVKVISTDIWNHKRVLVSTVANKRIYIYIYVVAVFLHIESRCRLDLRNNSLHHFIIHRNLRLNSSKSN